MQVFRSYLTANSAFAQLRDQLNRGTAAAGSADLVASSNLEAVGEVVEHEPTTPEEAEEVPDVAATWTKTDWQMLTEEIDPRGMLDMQHAYVRLAILNRIELLAASADAEALETLSRTFLNVLDPNAWRYDDSSMGDDTNE
jgi:hypothetical protein